MRNQIDNSALTIFICSTAFNWNIDKVKGTNLYTQKFKNLINNFHKEITSNEVKFFKAMSSTKTDEKDYCQAAGCIEDISESVTRIMSKDPLKLFSLKEYLKAFEEENFEVVGDDNLKEIKELREEIERLKSENEELKRHIRNFKSSVK